MQCIHVPVENYGDFGQRLREQAVSQRIPITGSIEVTSRCNLNCAHCYISGQKTDPQESGRELTTEDLFDIINQIVDAGCLSILLTGGEPFVRPDFLDIYSYAKKKGLLITLFTNGTTITRHIADYLARWCPFSIEVTLYGSTPDTYERITGIPGSFQKCMNGIQLLKNRNLPLKLKSVVMSLNHHELDEMRLFAEKLGVTFRFDPILNLRLDGNRQPEKFRLSPHEVVALELSDEKRMESWHQYYNKFSGPPPNPQYLYQCGAGVSTFHIDAFGKLSPCLMSRVPGYDLLEGSFREGWNGSILKQRTRKWTAETPCKQCDIISLCGQCPGVAQIENNNPELPVAYLCRIAHLRAEAFGIRESRFGVKNDKKIRKKNISQAL